MTETKFFQVRDRMTHIPVMCTLLIAGDGEDSRELRRAGFGVGTPYYLMTNLVTMATNYDPFQWSNFHTLGTVHVHIGEVWPSLESGQVLDAEFIRGETETPKSAE